LTGLYLLGPEAVVVVVAAEAGDANANAILRTGDDAVGPLGVVLKAEHQLGQYLGIHIGQLVRPNLANLVAGAGAEAATLSDFEGGLQADGDGPAGGVLGDVGLVNPGAGKVKTGGYLAFCLFEVGGGAGFESFLGYALQHHIFYSVLLAELALVFVAAIAVHHQDIGSDSLHGGDKVHDAAALVDEGIFHVADALDHEQALLLGVDGLVVLILQNRCIGPNSHVQVPIFGRLSEELHVA